MRDLAYQRRVLNTFEAYLAELSRQKQGADRVAEIVRQNPGVPIPIPDYAALTWEAMKAANWTGPRLPVSRQDIPYSVRLDGINRSVPNVCFKVPTAGGKTYLAVSALSELFGRYLATNHGFVLWIVPNEAIYEQTKRNFKDREHPYRQTLDRLAAGRVKILEREDRLDARDIESHLCVMLLMLQAANRETKESLRLFRDRGNVTGFFPSESDGEAHRQLLTEIPNLDAYSDEQSFWPVVKDSMGNVMRLIRPVVVIDEGHRAISDLAVQTLYGFNPCFVLELTATPKDRRSGNKVFHANVLVDVLGTELDREGMIKMPINVEVRSGEDWRDALVRSTITLNELRDHAERLQADTGRYIRPIMLVQVERTGDDQRDGVHIHALDVKDFLLQSGFTESEIAIKTAQVNDLSAPENIDLLANTCPVRVIITKQALQEGWDCPFAYILCSLAASRNLSAMTQLIGRILRQPQAQKTGIPALDECYVICHHAATGVIVGKIKESLEDAGLSDLVHSVRLVDVSPDAGGQKPTARPLQRREMFRDLEIFLPLVMKVDGEEVRPLDYEQDILSDIDWTRLDVNSLVNRIPDNVQTIETQLRRIYLTDTGGDELIRDEEVGRHAEALYFDSAYAARVIYDIVNNPYVARAIIGDIMAGLVARGFDDARLGTMASFILGELRKWLISERDRLAENVFMEQVASQQIQFRLRMDTHNWRMPDTIYTTQPTTARQLMRETGNPLEKSLFVPVYEDDMDVDERHFACYLDELGALRWWHRNIARADYGLQGWRKHKVYPDFIFAFTRDNGSQKIVVLETKGEHLDSNNDTTYKRRLLQVLSGEYRTEPRSIGALELVVDDQTTVICDLVLMDEWQGRLHSEILTG